MKEGTAMNGFRSVYFHLRPWQSRKLLQLTRHNLRTQRFRLALEIWDGSKKTKNPKPSKPTKPSCTQANYNKSMWIFFLSFYLFLLSMVFFLKEAVHQRAFCSYSFVVFFYRGKYCTTHFFFFSKQYLVEYRLNTWFRTAWSPPFQGPSSGESLRSVCVVSLVVHVLLNINQSVALTDFF